MTLAKLTRHTAIYWLAVCLAAAGAAWLWQMELRLLSLTIGLFTIGATLGRLLAQRSHAVVTFLFLVIGLAVVEQASTPIMKRPTLEDVWGNFMMWMLWDGPPLTPGWTFVGICAFVLGVGILGILIGHSLRPARSARIESQTISNVASES